MTISRETSMRARGLAAVLIIFVVAGCAGHRAPRTQAQLLADRARADAQYQADSKALFERLLARAKAKHDQNPDGQTTIDILVISGGGDWGAFGAGFLKGWGHTTDKSATRPQFDVVTGVSTGALIAPFAFVGDDASIERVVQLYRNPKKNWVKQRWPLYFLPSNISFAEVPGLEKELRESADVPFIQRIAQESKTRMLLMNTSNVDDGGMRVWDVGSEAQRAVESGNYSRVHTIMLASSGIPGAFPFRIIDNEMYVDGGVTGNIIYGGRVREEDSLPALWKQRYPDLPMPKTRYWVIFNNQLRPLPQVTEPTWPAVVSRSLEMGTRSATVMSMRHLFAMAELSRLKRGAPTEIRIVAVPNDWAAPKPGVFIKETMNALADLGEKMGADPNSWMTTPPP
jgi:predicted acylesterase/phospholipase RssA